MIEQKHWNDLGLLLLAAAERHAKTDSYPAAALYAQTAGRAFAAPMQSPGPLPAGDDGAVAPTFAEIVTVWLDALDAASLRPALERTFGDVLREDDVRRWIAERATCIFETVGRTRYEFADGSAVVAVNGPGGRFFTGVRGVEQLRGVNASERHRCTCVAGYDGEPLITCPHVAEARAAVAEMLGEPVEPGNAPPRYVIFEEYGLARPVDVAAFAADNDLDEEERGWIAALAVGEAVPFGGGACPLVTIRRVS